MRTWRKILICVTLLAELASFTHGQTAKTVKGYLCAKEEGMHAGILVVRVGSKVVNVDYTWNVPSGESGNHVKTTRFIGKHWDRIGAELVITYEADGRGKFAIRVKGTGRFEKTTPCSVE